MRTDEGFKLLFASYPTESLAELCPQVLAEWGRPSRAELLATEALPVVLQRSGRHMDFAVRFDWPDGRQAAVLLIEHWSDAGKVDLRRVLRYVAELAARYPALPILPVVLVSDARPTVVAGTLAIGVPGWTAATLDARVVRLRSLTDATRPRTRVAWVLAALPQAMDPVRNVLCLLRGIMDAPGPTEHVHWLLPLIQNLAKLSPRNQRRLLERLHQETTMLDIAAILKAEGRAEGKAEGKAEGLIALIRLRVTRNRMTVDEARAEIRELVQQGSITQAEADAALAKLG